MKHFTTVLLVQAESLPAALFRILSEHARQEICIVILGHSSPYNRARMVLNHFFILVLQQLSPALQYNAPSRHQIALSIG